jgi:hypothetical protein
MAALGDFIGRLPFVPDISPDVLNAILFASAVGIPSGYKAAATFWPEGRFLTAAVLFFVCFVAFISWTFGDLFVWDSPGDYFFDPYAAIVVPLTFTFALVRLRGYAKGFISVLTFIATIQILYWLNAPWFADWVNREINGSSYPQS